MAFTKIKIEGTIEVKTGLHIGGDDSFSAIGAIDSPVVRDPLTREPIIPGSSLKGKLRSLLARDFCTTPMEGVRGFEKDCREIKRLFGSSERGSDASGLGMQMSRLQFSDCFLENQGELPSFTEAKFENSIDRLTSIANPRQIERVIRGSEFGFEIIYNVEDPDEVAEDFANLETAFCLLENDYLGGGGTRGNGRVSFVDVVAGVAVGDFDLDIPEGRYIKKLG
ncbi:MAG: type III-A CRISPR-associated RAMP protein Csm3 [Coriobacteriia bacterium]|nr:type III-A CRISPR-associated RAMP protein Csm3 [Coriobacteriia bacterium]